MVARALVAVLLTGTLPAMAEKPPQPFGAERLASFQTDVMSFRPPTLGGRQFWADQLVLHDWRIQQNVFTGHSRLLDPSDRRVASGGYDECRDRFETIQAEQQIPSLKPRTVVLLHGLWRSRGAMRPLQEHLSQNDAWSVISVEYPSTRATVGEHAAVLKRVVDNLEGVDQIDFVCHSLGNLVVRRWLHDYYLPACEALPADGGSGPPRLGRMVMLGPPNNRPELAGWVVPLDVTGQVYGPSGRQLNDKWDELAPTLTVPPCEFGILAGGNAKSGRNPLIPGDDDLVVTVDNTRLAGAADFRVVPAIHTLLMGHPDVQAMTERFLLEGSFEGSGQRQPIAE
ncbi:Alpha/beta hydrolase family protein [Posidoniimonas polymericola]|uniref:Alpha/beta hydrolase family protein n=1 Tax=Posidoniimonas polymericola TaxID=2528002 RepID=A0A5C5YSR7_9BACT|nr:hypothetical protein [Posidoniimonas polymericola]TWT77687.1 Alpha/beta hydrolase family protein [Posidoniimonas polymericola]